MTIRGVPPRTRRHTAVNHAVCGALAPLRQRGFHLTMETNMDPLVQRIASSTLPAGLRADAVLTDHNAGGQQWFLDITIKHPEPGVPPAVTARLAEDAKITKYRKHYHFSINDGIVPFVVTTQGVWGTRAEAFATWAAKTLSSQPGTDVSCYATTIRRLIERVTVAAQKGNAACIAHVRKQCHVPALQPA